jgi:hypothetical protein
MPSISGSPDLFFSAFTRARDLMKVYGGDYFDIARESPDPQCVAFWEVIWPEFLKQIEPLRRRLPTTALTPPKGRSASRTLLRH